MDYVSALDHSTAVGLVCSSFVRCFISLKSVAALSKCKIMIKVSLLSFSCYSIKPAKLFWGETHPQISLWWLMNRPEIKKVPLCDLPPSWWTSLNAILEKSLIKLLLSWILSILNLHPQCYPNFISDQKVRHASSHNQSQTAGQDFPQLLFENHRILNLRKVWISKMM